MCGIFGFYSFGHSIVNKINFERGLSSMKHRGPDNETCEYYNYDKVAFGHARLSIVDLTPSANQPMHVGKYTIVYNGEVYNYIELRKELIDCGYLFSTDSDTEVIVNAYDLWGNDCVHKFNGMWAFSIYNVETNSLFCSRDRFGVKPFNYFLNEDVFIFSSEIKSLLDYDATLAEPNFNSIALYSREGISGEIPESWFKGILRLMPAHNMVIRDGRVEIIRYYRYPRIDVNIKKQEAEKKFQDLFIDAVKIRMRSDVPVGTTLSGGIDSTSIVAAIRTFSNMPIETFTACFPEYNNDESNTVVKTNLVYRLNQNLISVKYGTDYLTILKKIIYHLESGNLSPSVVPLWSVYESAQKKVTVVLEGQGADELMGGYIELFAGSFVVDRLFNFRFLSATRNLIAFSKDFSARIILVFYFREILPSFLKSLYRRFVLRQESVLIGPLKKFKHSSVVDVSTRSRMKKVLQKSHQTTLVNLLHYGDAISMAFSIESRLPFMDYRLVDFVYSLPTELLISGGRGKFIQRVSLKNILPDYINEDRRKLGFLSPIDDFFTENKEILKSILLDPRTIQRGLFCQKELKRMLIDTEVINMNSSRFLFRLLSIELWFREFID
jgi:asparagine synthase (glutamine-hydrolysing)